MTRKHRTYHDILNRNNEESAYVLGLWMADGSISFSTSRGGKRTQKSFSIYNTDEQLIRMIGRLFSKEPTKRWNGNPKHKPCFRIRVKSDRLFDTCYSVTGSTSKSNKPIPIPDVSDELFHHFVRGFFDGDGSIYFKTYKNRHGKTTTELGTSFTAGKDTGSS